MHVDVNDILRQGEGAQEGYSIADEQPQFEDVKLTAPLSGEIRIIGTKTGVLVAGKIMAKVELECHRCLRTFEHQFSFPIEAVFSPQPNEDEYQIDKYGKIDLEEPIRQDLVTHLPLRQLCQADCDGIQLKAKKEANGSS